MVSFPVWSKFGKPTLPELHDDRLIAQTRASPDSLAVARRAALSQLSYTTSRDTNLRDRAGRNRLLDSLGTVAPGGEKTIRRGG